MTRLILTALTVLLGLAVSIPALADGEGEEPAACPIAGIWRFKCMDVDGHVIKRVDDWEGILVVQADGAMAIYPDDEAYAASLPQRTGWYEIDEDGWVNYIRDRNGNGEIEQVERDSNDDDYRVQVKEEGIVFVLELIITEGPELIQYIYEPYEE